MLPAGEREYERLFVLVLTQHRRWGSVLLPYIIERMPGVVVLSNDRTAITPS